MGILKRLSTVFKSNANAAIDEIEDSIKMTNQGILDLKEQLNKARHSLATAKANSIKAHREYKAALVKPEEYEQKAVALLKKVEHGELSADDGDRLATEALAKKEAFIKEVEHRLDVYNNLKTNADKFENDINKLRKEIENWENKARTLRSRKDLADSRVAMRQNMSSIDPSSTINMLKKMEEKVEKAEALAEAEDQLSISERTTDDEINAVLSAPSKSSDALAALKQKMAENKVV